MPVIPDQVRMMADRYPDELAHEVVDGDRLTFGEWYERANAVARGLRELGIEQGDRVATVVEDRDALRYLQAYIGVHQAGAVNVLINARFSSEEIHDLLDHAEPAAVLMSGGVIDLVREASPATVLHLVSLGEGTDGILGWDDLLGPGDPVEVELTEDDPADVLYTSGTTGKPKGVLTRHRNANQAPIQAPDDFTGQRWLHASPLASLAGQAFIITPSALGMSAAYLPPPFDPERWLRYVDGHDVGSCYVAPVMVEQLLAVDDVDRYDLSSLTLVTVGSAPIAPATLRAFDRLLPNATPQNSYSLTELGSGFTVMPEERFDEKAGSVGRPVDPFQVRIIDPETGDDLPAGETGEIVARVEGQRREYFRAPELDDERFEDGWFRTGDLGRFDDEGFLYVEGRLDDLIIRGGYNVSPADPERALYEDDRVQEAAVFGVPHPELGEQVVAAVVTVPNVEVDAETLLERLEERLGEPKRPSRIEIVDELPRNPDGKIDRNRLSERFADAAS